MSWSNSQSLLVLVPRSPGGSGNENAQIWVVLLVSRAAREICLKQSEALPRSIVGSVTLSVWNFSTRSASDVISRGDQFQNLISCFYFLRGVIRSCGITMKKSTSPNLTYMRLYSLSDHNLVIHI